MEELFSEFPILIAQNGPLLGQRWGIKTEIHIGRDPDCEIVVPDRQVSRVHARLTVNNNGVLLEDLRSKNGTFLNGALLESPTILEEGDIVQIALVQSFFFLSSDATMPLDRELLPDPQTVKKTPKIYLDFRSRRVWLGDQEILPPLSVPQFMLLHTLNEQQGKVVSRSDLIAMIWGEEKAVGVSEQALDALVRRLRDRLSLFDPSHEYLVTVRGHGIRLDNEPKQFK
jgi:pSer/pThr/pTyr-binding forkhead associated (FHA) protein